MQEDNGKQTPEDNYINKYQKHIPSSYDYALVYVGDKFSKPFKIYLGKDSVYNFINYMIKESKYCSGAMKKLFNKNLRWLKKAMKFLRTPLNASPVIIIMLIMVLTHQLAVLPSYRN